MTRVRLLRAWYFLRELLGHPRRLDQTAFDQASTTVLLAGSPWVWRTDSSTDAKFSFAVSNTTWTRSAPPA